MGRSYKDIKYDLWYNLAKLGILPGDIALAYKLQAGTISFDLSINKQHGAQAGPVFKKNGLFFDGNNDIITIPSDSRLFNPGTNDYTILSKAKRSSTGAWHTIFSRRSSANNQGVGLRFTHRDAVSMWAGDGAAFGMNDGKTYSADKIYNVSGTRSGNTLKTYVDGVETGSSTATLGNVDTSGIDAFLGVNTDDAMSGYFSGYIYHVIVVNKLLTPAQIFAVSNIDPFAPRPDITYFETGSTILPIKFTFNTDEMSKGVGPVTASQLGGLLVGG